MRFQLLGGPPEHEIPVPWPGQLPMPPFVCSGDQEPFQHYIRVMQLPLFVHVGECSTIDHQGRYPHVYFD